MKVSELLDVLDWYVDRNKKVMAIECGPIEEKDKIYNVTGVNIVDDQVILRIKED